MSEQTSYPLSWPERWRRTVPEKRRYSKFATKSDSRGLLSKSMQEACGSLSRELDRLGAQKAVLSCNVRRRLDGAPYSGLAQPADPGAAVYFVLKNKPVSLACDKWLRVEDNIYAIAKHVEALRGQERWGVGSLEQAFRGYMALPAVGESGASDWWKILGVPLNATPLQVREAYRLLARKYHPDTSGGGGDEDLFRRVQSAFEKFEALQKMGEVA